MLFKASYALLGHRCHLRSQVPFKRHPARPHRTLIARHDLVSGWMSGCSSGQGPAGRVDHPHSRNSFHILLVANGKGATFVNKYLRNSEMSLQVTFLMVEENFPMLSNVDDKKMALS